MDMDNNDTEHGLVVGAVLDCSDPQTQKDLLEWLDAIGLQPTRVDKDNDEG